MEGWVFAVALLFAVLAFELAAFRYFSDVSLGARLESNDPSATPPTEAALEGGGTATEADHDAHECHNCGTVNEDVATFHYCQHCLTRIN
ncbi:MAG: hypothetical protein V5A44_01980 [Haloarculaceae archaeon]